MKKEMKHFKDFVLGALLLFMVTPLTSQSVSTIDSAYQAILKEADDSAKVDKLLILSRQYTAIDPSKSWPFSVLAHQISEKLNYRNGKMDAMYEFSFIYKRLGKTDSAIFFIENYIRLSDTINEKRNLAKGYYSYANLMRLKGEMASAYNFLRKSERYFLTLNDSTGLSGVYNSLGNYFDNTSNADSAAVYYLKTIQLCENSKNQKNIGSVLNNLSDVYIRLKDYDNASKYLKQSLEVNIRFNNPLNIANAYSSFGNLASLQDQFSQALDYYAKAEVLFKQLNYSIGLNNLYINYGDIYQKQGKDSLAVINYDESLKFSNRSKYTKGIIFATKNKAAIFIKQKKYSQATALLNPCLKLTYQTNDRESRKDIFLYLSTISSELGDANKAYFFLNKYIALKDSIEETTTKTDIAKLTLKYEKEKDQARILILENENLAKDLSIRKRTNQRNAYLFSGLAIILIVLSVSGYFRNKSLREKIVSEQRIKQLEDEKKLLSVRFLVEGQEEERKRIAKEMHDGIGVLLATAKMQFSSISDVNPESKLHIEKATKLLEQATTDVRKITHNMMPGLLTKFGFFEAVEDLIEQLDDAGTISAKVVIEGEPFRFQENKEIMLYRIVQEMVHNTIKHANATLINLVLEILPEKLNMTFVDNGQGFDVPQMLQKQSIGLTSIQSRVSFLDGILNIDSSPGKGTIFRIKVSLS